MKRKLPTVPKILFWLIAAAAAAGIITVLCLLLARRETLDWAKNLKAQDIESIELVVMPQAADRQYKAFSDDEFEDVAKLLNESRGKYVQEPEALDGGSIFFYIKTSDAVEHMVGNIGNTYLFIDGDHYKAGYDWLATWDRYHDDGVSPVPAGFFQ